MCSMRFLSLSFFFLGDCAGVNLHFHFKGLDFTSKDQKDLIKDFKH